MKKNNNYLEKLENINSLYYELIGSPIYKDFQQDDKSEINRTYKNLNNEITKFKIEKEKIEKDELPLIIGFAGGFNTGKSSIINSILEEELLAVKIIPATAKVSILKYGDEQKIIAFNKDGTYEEFTKEDYLSLSTHNQQLEEKVEKVKHFEIQYPNEVLRNINIVDTPGLFSVHEEDNKITKECLEKGNLDVIIWVFDAGNKKEIDAKEKEKLKELENKKIIAILNKMEFKSHKKEEYVNFFKKEDFLKEVVPYSAKKILNFRKNQIYNDKVIDNILMKAKEERYNNNLIIKISRDRIRLSEDGIYFDIKANRFRDKNSGKFVAEEIVNLKNENLKITKGDNFQSEYEQLKKILNNLHSESKELKKNSYELNIKKLFKLYLQDLKKFKDKLKDKKRIKEKDLNRFLKVMDDFITDFNRKIDIDNKNIFKNQLFKKAVRLFQEDRIDELKELIKKNFTEFKDNQINEYNNFIKDQELEEYEINKYNFENLSYWLDELTSASINSIDGLELANFPLSELNRIKESIDLVVPDEQLYNVVKKTINNKLSDLKKRIKDKFQKEIDTIAQFLNKIEKMDSAKYGKFT